MQREANIGLRLGGSLEVILGGFTQ